MCLIKWINGGERQRFRDLCFGGCFERQLTLSLIGAARAAPAEAYRGGDDAGGDDQQTAHADQHEPRQLEAEQRVIVLTCNKIISIKLPLLPVEIVARRARLHLLRQMVCSSSEPSPQWLTLSHTRSGLMQNSLEMQWNSLHVCSAWNDKQKTFRYIELWRPRNVLHVFSLEFLTDVMTNLNPLASVPHPSVTYLSVTKFVCVVIVPTDCFVFRHDRSVCRRKWWECKCNRNRAELIQLKYTLRIFQILSSRIGAGDKNERLVSEHYSSINVFRSGEFCLYLTTVIIQLGGQSVCARAL